VDVEVKPGVTLKTAPIVGFGKESKVVVLPQPDPAKPGNTGLVVDFTISDWRVKRATFPTTVLITDSDGGQVVETSAELQKFAFG